MKKFKVSFRPLAEDDLIDLHGYIATHSGLDIAQDYIARIEEACTALSVFPQRGVPRDDIRAGLRILGFERRIAIAFQIKRNEVVIVRIFYGGQDYDRLLRGGQKP